MDLDHNHAAGLIPMSTQLLLPSRRDPDHIADTDKMVAVPAVKVESLVRDCMNICAFLSDFDTFANERSTLVQAVSNRRSHGGAVIGEGIEVVGNKAAANISGPAEYRRRHPLPIALARLHL